MWQRQLRDDQRDSGCGNVDHRHTYNHILSDLYIVDRCVNHNQSNDQYLNQRHDHNGRP